MLILSKQTDIGQLPEKPKLTKPLKDVIEVLSDNNGYTVTEIANKLGKTRNSINDRILRLVNLIPMKYETTLTSGSETKVWYLDKTG